MNAIKDLSSTKTDTLLKFILVSIQGRKPVSLYSIINGNSKLKATLTCSCIVKLMTPREVYLKHECLESSNYMFFIIEIQIPEPHNYEDYQPTGDNILAYCQVNESEEYFHHVTMDPKFKSYKVVRLQMKGNKLTLLGNGNRDGIKPDMSRNEAETYPKHTPDKEYRGLEYYFIDQNGESVYNMGVTEPVPVIGEALRLIKQLNDEECLEKIIVGSRLISVALLSDELKVEIAKIEGLNNEHNNHYIDNWGLDNKHLQNMPPEFLASPLYLNILRTISENQRSLEIVNRWTLYESIVNLKIERYCLRITPYCLDDSEKDNILIYHWQLALKVLFGNNQVTQKVANRQRKFSNYLRLGLITSYDDNEDPIFIHRTFAEYFFTQWLIENAHEEDARFIYRKMLRYEGQMGFERGISLLDIHCEQFPMYKAVLNQDLIQLEHLCMSNKGYLTEVDAIGRMAIHIAAIYCKIYPDEGNRYRILNTILQHMRKEEYDIYARDTILNWNWIAYLPYEKLNQTSIEIQEAYWHYHALSVDDLRAHPLPKDFNTDFSDSYNFAVSYSSISVIRDLLFLKYRKTEDFKKFHIACIEKIAEYPKHFKLPEENLTTLHLACIYSNMSIVKACIDRGDNINEVDAYNCTPLHYSVCDDRNTKIVELLIDKDINFKDKNGFTPFHLATKFNKVAMMEMLFENNADVNTANHNLDAPLHTAVQNECKDAVRILLEYKADINTINNSGKTPLYVAIELNTVGIAEMLLKQRADVNKVTVRFKTPLCHAIVSGSKTKDMVELLLKYFADVHLESPDGKTALYLAALRGNVEVVEMLLRNGTNINQVNKHGFTSLDVAIVSGQYNTVQILLKNQADVNFRDKDCSTPLYKAVGAMNKEMVEILLKNGAYLHCVNKFGFTPLITAVEEGFATAVEILLRNGADVNFKTESDITPLYVAALTRNIDIIALLLEYGADVDIITKGGEILSKAIERKNYNIIAWLVKKYMLRPSEPLHSLTVLEQAIHIDKQIEIPKDAVLETALCIALEEENPMSRSVMNIYAQSKIQLPSKNYIKSEEVFRSAYLYFGLKRRNKDLSKILVENFIKENVDDIARGNPLCFAAKEDSFMSVMMLRNGADPNAQDVDGRTPLLIFIDRNRNINTLLIFKPDANLADRNGTTPLLAAIRKHSIQNIKLLLQNGADVNYVENGVTPLVCAASESHLPILQMLLDNNAEVNFVDQCGLTALYVAALNGDERILKLLLQYGATTDIIIDGNILLRNAIEIGNRLAVKLLLNLSRGNGASSNITSEDIVKKVFKNKANVNVALHLAINAGDIEMVKLVLAYDPKLNERDGNGSTALHIAVNLNRIDIVEMLLKFHVDVQQKNNDDLTPLDYAINNGNYEIMEMLCIAGVCRTDELCNMKVADVVLRQDIIVINIPHTKNKSCRKFVIVEPMRIDVVTRYMLIRPSPDIPRLFMDFRSGKPTRQNIGHNTISTSAIKIATYLKLPDANNYTGHSFRRTSTTILVDNGGDILSLKRHGGWKSSTIAEGYVEDSITDKKRIASMVQGTTLNYELGLPPSTSIFEVTPSTSTSVSKSNTELNIPVENFTSNTGLSIT
ncbi:molting protein mlt-4 [Holotrichia oblita]|uniref:Molting protein mlt-4 n=1 Tax=Holotrichia oblita TaxID=644536 RepID=A0ACB9SK14_HOLOL|nr:molting protein mlt-4 [Holotrichia oblita]